MLYFEIPTLQLFLDLDVFSVIVDRPQNAVMVQQ